MSDHNFTSSEVREVLMEMGKAVGNEEELMYLTREVNLELPPSDHSDPDNYDINDVIGNDSIFASLSIDPEWRSKEKQKSKSPAYSPNSPNFSNQCFDDYICSPIVHRKKQGVYEPVDYPQRVESPTLGEEASSLVREAYESIHRAYKTCENVGKVSKNVFNQIKNKGKSLFESKITDTDTQNQSKVDEDELIKQHTEDLRNDGENQEDQEYVDDDEFENQYDEEIEILDSESQDPSKSRKSSEHVIMDPCYRPVLNPKPGKAPFKCDPVTRFQLYKEEWERHPAPGEERRLALRWKLRDKLLHYEIPNVQHPFRKAEHPKDWSPKPYLD